MTKHIWYLKSFLLLTGILGIFVFFSFVRAEEIDMNKIAWLESRGNPMAYNKVSQARGLFQITPICLVDYNKCNGSNFSLDDLFSPTINKMIAVWYLEKRLPEQLRAYGKEVNIYNLLWAYHAGAKRVKDNILPRTTREYIKSYFK